MKQMVYLDQIAYLFVYLNIVQPLICKTVARLLGEFEMKKSAENHNIYLKLKIMQIVIEIINNNTILKTWNRIFSRLKDVHYNHCASLPVQFTFHLFLLARDVHHGSCTLKSVDVILCFNVSIPFTCSLYNVYK